MKKFIYMLLFCLLISCSEKEKTSMPITPLVVTTEEDLIFNQVAEDLIIPYPLSMFLTDSLLVIQDYQANKSAFYAYDRNSYHFKQTFADKGRGESEILNCSNNYWLLNDRLVVYDDQMKNLLTYKIIGDSITYESKKSGKNLERVSKGWIHDLYQINDSISLAIGVTGVFDTNRFLVFNDTSYSLHCEDPNLEKHLDGNSFNDMVHGPYYFKLNAKNQRVVFGTYKGGLFEIFDYSTLPNEMKVVKSQLACPPFRGKEKMREVVFGFEDIFVTDNHIYALYNGQGPENKYFAKAVYIFDWDGNIIKRLNSDLYLKTICVDEKRGELYAMAFDPDKDFFLVKAKI